jgi:hypothetical protein
MKFETTNAEEKWETTKLREVINLFVGAIKGQEQVTPLIQPAEEMLPGITSYMKSIGNSSLLEGVKAVKIRTYGVLDLREIFWNKGVPTDDYKTLDEIHKETYTYTDKRLIDEYHLHILTLYKHMDTKSFISKLIVWQLNDWNTFTILSPLEQKNYLQKIIDYRDGKILKADNISNEKYEDIRKLASFKLEYFIQMMEQIGLVYNGEIKVVDHEKFLRDLF